MYVPSPELSARVLIKLCSFLFWGALYVYCSVVDPRATEEWKSRIITLLHGSVASLGGLAQCGVFSISVARLSTKIMPWHYALMVWSWGYFAFDLLWCVIYWTHHYLILVHHMSALLAITLYMNKDYTGCTFSCTLLMMEITNPLLQTRWFLKQAGMDKTLAFYVIEISYLVLFFFIRGVLGSCLVVKVLLSDFFDMEGKIICVIFYFVSVGLMYQIAGYIFYQYKNQIGDFTDFLDEMGIILNDIM